MHFPKPKLNIPIPSDILNAISGTNYKAYFLLSKEIWHCIIIGTELYEER